ncbi:hypothetical protein [Streptomyces sp. NPDC020996]|uniref:hypothetical protein n=1 Tax=Streptomyces sp. NPDC020996 TaxID=3154791 RepID=UPI00340D5BF5
MTNLVAAPLPHFWSRGRLPRRRRREEVRRLIEQYGIKTATVDQPLSSLSGATSPTA